MPTKSKTSSFETTADTYIKNLKKLAESRSDPDQAFSVEELQKFSLHHPVIIQGGEPFRAKRMISFTSEVLFPNQTEKKVRTYFASDLGNQSVINSLLAESKGGSLFSKTSCVALFDTETLKVGAIDKLVELLSLKKSEVFFLVVAGEKANKLLDALNGNFLTVNIAQLKGDQLAKWAVKELERLGHKGGIEPRATDCLVRSFGEDATRLSSELGKLTLLVSQDALIRLCDVESLLLQKPEHNTFSLLESIAERDVRGALKIHHALVEQGMHALQILALLSKSLRSLSALTDTPTEKLHSDISNPWILRNIPKSRKLFSKRELANTLSLTARLDSDLKGSKRGSDELVEDLIVKIASR